MSWKELNAVDNERCVEDSRRCVGLYVSSPLTVRSVVEGRVAVAIGAIRVSLSDGFISLQFNAEPKSQLFS